MTTHTPATDRRPGSDDDGNTIGCRAVTSVQSDGTWIIRYPCALELATSRTDHSARRRSNERATRPVPDSAETRSLHGTLDDELAVTADEQVKLALRSLIHRRQHAVRQSLRRTSPR